MLSGCFAAIVFLQYGAALRVGWLSDDFVLAEWAARREWIHAASTGFVRPIVPMVWAFLSFLPFGWPAALHAANLLLHALNGVLIAAIAARLGVDRQEALAAGVIFVTLSAMTEALVWVSGMQDVLMATLALVAVLATLGISAGSAWRQRGVSLVMAPVFLPVLAMASAALALGVKETAVVIPALACAAAWASPEGVGKGDRRRTLIAITVVAVLYAIVRLISGVSSTHGPGLSRYFFKQLTVDPFATLGEPWSAAWLQGHPLLALTRAAIIVGLLAAAGLTWRRREMRLRRAVASAAWVLLGVLPVFGLFHVSESLEGSRYLYLPAAGFALLLAALMGDLIRRVPSRTVASGLMAALVLAFAVPSLAASREELARWTEAARLRDEILTAYVRVMPSASCGSIVAEGLVDSVDGAYVLRNGFRQALDEMGARVDAAQVSPACRIDWTDHLIVRQAP